MREDPAGFDRADLGSANKTSRTLAVMTQSGGWATIPPGRACPTRDPASASLAPTGSRSLAVTPANAAPATPRNTRLRLTRRPESILEPHQVKGRQAPIPDRTHQPAARLLPTLGRSPNRLGKRRAYIEEDPRSGAARPVSQAEPGFLPPHARSQVAVDQVSRIVEAIAETRPRP